MKQNQKTKKTYSAAGGVHHIFESIFSETSAINCCIQ